MQSRAPAAAPIRPNWPQVKTFVDVINHARVFDETADLLPYSNVSKIREAMNGLGAKLLQIRAGTDVSTLTESWIPLLGHLQQLEARDTSTSKVVEQLLQDGARYGFHGTDCLTYSLLKGQWIQNPRALRVQSLNSHQFHIGNPQPLSREAIHTMSNYVNGANSLGLKIMEELGLSITRQIRALASKGILLAVDLTGYRSLRIGKETSCIVNDSEGLVAACPPPPLFIKPIVVADRGSADTEQDSLEELDLH